MNIEEIEPEMCFQIDYYGETIWIAKMVDDPYETAGVGPTEEEAIAKWRLMQSLADWSRA